MGLERLTITAGTAALVLGCSLQLESPDASFDEQRQRAIRLTAGEDRQTNGYFGYEIALHGTSLLAAAPLQDSRTVESVGVAHLFERNGGEWLRTAIAAPNQGFEDGQADPSGAPPDAVLPTPLGGMSVELDDELVVIGWSGEDSGSQLDQTDNTTKNSGAVFVYSRADLRAPPQYLKAAAPGELHHFGLTTALSDSWLAVGDAGDDSAKRDDPFNDDAEAAGAVYVYARVPGGVGKRHYVKAPVPSAGDLFGASVAVSDDLLAVGAVAEDSASTGAGGDQTNDDALAIGAAYVFRWQGDEWVFDEYLKPTNRMNRQSFFGASLAFSGNTLAIGASGATGCADQAPGDTTTPGRGAVYIANLRENGWSVDQCLTPQGPDLAELFGFRLALSGDTLVTGGPFDSEAEACDVNGDFFDRSLHNCGAAYVLERGSDGEWKEVQVLNAPDPRPDFVYGQSVAMSDDLIAVSSPQESVLDSNSETESFGYAGTVYVYSRTAPAR
jgi:hypothetical protein